MTDSPNTPPSRPEDDAPRPGDRIAKVLARAGVASRRAAEAMIAEGRVAVNGRRVDGPALNVTSADRITVDGAPLAPPDPPRLWLYHKPAGLVNTARDEKGRETVFDALPGDMPRVMSVGRLDLNSEGLLLLTNDGELKRRLELPATGWLRKYRVRVNGTPEDADFAPLRDGITVDGERFQPMTVTLDRQQGANAWLTVGLREGRNREIRRAMEVVGLPVSRLIRVGYGPFRLGKLAAGEVEEVRRKVLRDQLGIEMPDEDLTGTARARPRRGPQGPRPVPRKPAGGAEGAPSGTPARARAKAGGAPGRAGDAPGPATRRGAGFGPGGKAPSRRGPARGDDERPGHGPKGGGSTTKDVRTPRPGKPAAPGGKPAPKRAGPGKPGGRPHGAGKGPKPR